MCVYVCVYVCVCEFIWCVNLVVDLFTENPKPEVGNVQVFLLNEERKTHPQTGANYMETINLEINYERGSWRKVRRKRNLASSGAAT